MTPPSGTKHLDPAQQRGGISICQVCGGKMEQVYQSGHLQVCVCIDCFSGIYIPVRAWDVVSRKHPDSV